MHVAIANSLPRSTARPVSCLSMTSRHEAGKDELRNVGTISWSAQALNFFMPALSGRGTAVLGPPTSAITFERQLPRRAVREIMTGALYAQPRSREHDAWSPNVLTSPQSPT